MPISPWLLLLSCGETEPDTTPGDSTASEDTTTDTAPTDSAPTDTDTATTPDADGDGHGATSAGGDDCDDADASVNPDATETCDGIDEDCDGEVDNDATDATASYPDADGDTYGDASLIHVSCITPAGNVSDDQDCDDTDPSVNPAATEICGDGIDQDCDGTSSGCLWTGDVDVGSGEATVTDPATACGSVPSLSGGDVSGDGTPDLVLGCPYASTYETYEGAAYVLFGLVSGEAELTSADARFIGEEPGDFAGKSVHAADLDGDGQLDVVVGADGHDFGGEDAGAAYVIYGPVTGEWDLSLADAKAVGEEESDLAGWALGAGDVTGDGATDLLVGAVGGRYEGAVYVLAGPVAGTMGLGAADAILVGEDTSGSSYAGWATVAADLNGDGTDDIVTGAAGNGHAGAAYVTLGPVTGVLALADAEAKFDGEYLYNYAGEALAAGDFDGDGSLDVAVGAPYEGENPRNQGATYVVLAPATGDRSLADADAKLHGADGREFAGGSISAADLDDDGTAELAIGALYGVVDGEQTPVVYLAAAPFAGTTSLADAQARFIASGAPGRLGGTVFAGDLDGEGALDLLLGGGGDGVAAYVLYGPGY